MFSHGYDRNDKKKIVRVMDIWWQLKQTALYKRAAHLQTMQSKYQTEEYYIRLSNLCFRCMRVQWMYVVYVLYPFQAINADKFHHIYLRKKSFALFSIPKLHSLSEQCGKLDCTFFHGRFCGMFYNFGHISCSYGASCPLIMMTR